MLEILKSLQFFQISSWFSLIAMKFDRIFSDFVDNSEKRCNFSKLLDFISIWLLNDFIFKWFHFQIFDLISNLIFTEPPSRGWLRRPPGFQAGAFGRHGVLPPVSCSQLQRSRSRLYGLRLQCPTSHLKALAESVNAWREVFLFPWCQFDLRTHLLVAALPCITCIRVILFLAFMFVYFVLVF